MRKRKELKTITNMVKEILLKDRLARNSDICLYIRVCEQVNPEALREPFVKVMADLKAYGLPNIETVGRCKRKIVEHYPELAGDSDIESQRMLNEEEYREYARQVIV